MPRLCLTTAKAKTLADESKKIAALCSSISDGIHDILNDHAIVSGRCELALRETEDAAKHITIAIGALGRATETARQLLAGPRQTDLLLDLRALILESEPRLRTEIGSGVELVLELDERVPLIIGSAEIIYRLLKNLCFNSRDAFQNVARPTISIGLAERVGNAVNMVQLRFRDNGCGMNSEQVARILAGGPFTTKQDGGGMGMEIIRSAIRECGGQMSLSSVKGVGTAFTFLFPKA